MGLSMPEQIGVVACRLSSWPEPELPPVLEDMDWKWLSLPGHPPERRFLVGRGRSVVATRVGNVVKLRAVHHPEVDGKVWPDRYEYLCPYGPVDEAKLANYSIDLAQVERVELLRVEPQIWVQEPVHYSYPRLLILSSPTNPMPVRSLVCRPGAHVVVLDYRDNPWLWGDPTTFTQVPAPSDSVLEHGPRVFHRHPDGWFVPKGLAIERLDRYLHDCTREQSTRSCQQLQRIYQRAGLDGLAWVLARLEPRLPGLDEVFQVLSLQALETQNRLHRYLDVRIPYRWLVRDKYQLSVEEDLCFLDTRVLDSPAAAIRSLLEVPSDGVDLDALTILQALWEELQESELPASTPVAEVMARLLYKSLGQTSKPLSETERARYLAEFNRQLAVKERERRCHEHDDDE
ncbi:MAG: hypothetical protein NZ482_03665 [Gloeomargarita sp. SKYG98]|nr:hypothetical protein [Gloeomargarita sp. SKYG98]